MRHLDKQFLSRLNVPSGNIILLIGHELDIRRRGMRLDDHCMLRHLIAFFVIATRCNFNTSIYHHISLSNYFPCKKSISISRPDSEALHELLCLIGTNPDTYRDRRIYNIQPAQLIFLGHTIEVIDDLSHPAAPFTVTRLDALPRPHACLSSALLSLFQPLLERFFIHLADSSESERYGNQTDDEQPKYSQITS